MNTHFIDHIVPLGYEDATGFHFLQGRVRGTRRPHKPTQLGSTPSPATSFGKSGRSDKACVSNISITASGDRSDLPTLSSIHGSRGYGMVARVVKGIWHARHFFFPWSIVNQRGHRLGRLLLVSHGDWRDCL